VAGACKLIFHLTDFEYFMPVESRKAENSRTTEFVPAAADVHLALIGRGVYIHPHSVKSFLLRDEISFILFFTLVKRVKLRKAFKSRR
jgi:hypothetical protein